MLKTLRNNKLINILSKIFYILFLIGLLFMVIGAMSENPTTGSVGLYIVLATLVPTVLSVIFRIGFHENSAANVHEVGQRSSNKKDGKFMYRQDEEKDYICYCRYYAETGEYIDTLMQEEIPQNIEKMPLDAFVDMMSSKILAHFRFIKAPVSAEHIRRVLVYYFRFKHLDILEPGQFLRKSDNIILLEETYHQGDPITDTTAKIELAWIDKKIHLNCIVKTDDNRGNNNICKNIAIDDDLIFVPTLEILIKYRKEIMEFFTKYINDFGIEDEGDFDGLTLFSCDSEFFDFAGDVWKPLFPAEIKINEEKSEIDECEVMINVLTGQLLYHSAHTYPFFSYFKTNHQTQLITYPEMKEKLKLADKKIAEMFEPMTEANWEEFV